MILEKYTGVTRRVMHKAAKEIRRSFFLENVVLKVR